jgi:hypothetical protein
MKRAILPMLSGLAMIILAARQGKEQREYFKKLEVISNG